MRIAELLPDNAKVDGKWTAEKVKYAWYHGVLDRCQLDLGPLHWSEKLSQDVNLAKMDMYLQG
jgi:hypothetical protein